MPIKTFFIYLAVMAITTYLIRMIPFVIFPAWNSLKQFENDMSLSFPGVLTVIDLVQRF